MSIIGKILGILAAIIMLLGLIPLLGWLNWLSIPIAIIGLIFSAIGKENNSGLKINGIVILFGILRLIFGGGII
ncbi:MAG: hypothetical protein WBM13_15265 [Bacteroidia bacterium]